jgi:cysteine synthase A
MLHLQNKECSHIMQAVALQRDCQDSGTGTLPEYPQRNWARRAIAVLDAEGHRSADTNLVYPPMPALGGISIYLKDESTHPTGSLKHRLAKSLFLYGICNG